MAFALGPILLLTVVGAAVFGGLDVRKKRKKNGVPSIDNGVPPPTLDVVPCAHVIDVNADGSMFSLDGGPWVAVASFPEPPEIALQNQAPTVMFGLCTPDPLALRVINDLCAQQSGIQFYGAYVYRVPDGSAKQGVLQLCAQRNIITEFTIFTPMGGNVVRVYESDAIPELRYHSGDDIAQVFVAILSAAAGADHPEAYDVEVGG